MRIWNINPICSFFSLTHSRQWLFKKGILCKALPLSGSLLLLYIQKLYVNQAFCEKRMPSLSVHACFAGKWNTQMMSQSKLNLFSCVFVRGLKKHPTSSVWSRATSEGKIQGQKRFCQSNQSSSKSLFMQTEILKVSVNLTIRSWQGWCYLLWKNTFFSYRHKTFGTKKKKYWFVFKGNSWTWKSFVCPC